MSEVKEEDKKKGDQPATYINIRINGQTGIHEIFFRIKRNVKLKRLINAYCDRQSIDIHTVVFLFDGRRLNAEQTPDDLKMEEGDQIDCMEHQIGAGGYDMARRSLYLEAQLRILKT